MTSASPCPFTPPELVAGSEAVDVVDVVGATSLLDGSCALVATLFLLESGALMRGAGGAMRGDERTRADLDASSLNILTQK